MFAKLSKYWQIENNIVYHSQCGIELGAEEPGATVENFYVRGNLVIDCGRSLGVGGYQDTSATHRNAYVYNNTFIGGTWYKENNMIFIENTSNLKLYNNIFYAQSGNGLVSNSGGTSLDFNYNCWYKPSLKTLPSEEGSNSFIADPLFVLNSGDLSGNYTLQESSRCIETGLYDNNCSNYDLKGKARVNKVIDIGCYER